MLDIIKIDDKDIIRLASNRHGSSGDLWAKIETDYRKYKAVWENFPEWLKNIPATKSTIRDNRVHLSVETNISMVTARPSKPSVSAANETDEAKEVSESLHKLLLQKYRELDVRKTMKRGLRYLFFSKLIVLKVFWNREIDDFDTRVVDVRKVRFSKRSTNEKESEFVIEDIETNLLNLIEDFPDKREEILKNANTTIGDAIVNNPDVMYQELWIGNGVASIFRGEVLKKSLNPYYDFKGLKLTPQEMKRLEKTSGRRRRQMFTKFKQIQEERNMEGWANTYELYLYNHFDTVRKPYIFGTVLEVESKPAGDSSSMDQINPLQEGVDKRKRQISDNAEEVNGITKIDTNIVRIGKAEARRIHHDQAGGLIYGPGVKGGVTRETGQSLPAMVFDDLEHSIREIDNIANTGNTARGEGGDNETATGRAILRESNLLAKDELIALVDYMHEELYNWWIQLIKVNYTESHLVKPLGEEDAEETIDLMQDDLEDGLEVKVISGQVLPDDKIFRAERAREDVKDGIVDPITYLEVAGGYDNPKETAKRMLMWKTNPFSLVELDDTELNSIIEANELLKQIGQSESEDQGDDGGSEIAAQRQRILEIVESEEFKERSPEEQSAILQQLRERFGSKALPVQTT